MGISTAQDRSNLGSQNLYSDYQKHTADLVAVAKIVYAALLALTGSPQPNDLEPSLTFALFRSGRFARMIRSRPHIHPSLHMPYAAALARVLLDDQWPSISN